MIGVRTKVYCCQIQKLHGVFFVLFEQVNEVAEAEDSEAIVFAQIQFRVADETRYVVGRTYDLKIG